MADISKIKLPNNSEYNIKDTEGRKEAYLEWGGRNFSANYGCIDAAMIDVLGANRFAFLKAAGITIEYSTDGGSTWLDYGSNDTSKTGLFGRGSAHYLGKHKTNGTSTINDMLRVTIATGAAGVYTTLNKIAIYMSTSGNTVQVLVEKALESTPTNYVTHLDWTGIAGWSGWNILNINGITTYGNSAAFQYGRIRFTFKQTAVTTTYTAAVISRIMGFGGVGWSTPSNMATDGHMYSYDNAQNVTFPNKVTATGGFAGNVTGNVSGTASNVTGTVAIANGGTGQTTAVNAANTFLSNLPDWTANPTDTTKLIRRDTGGASQFGQVTFATVWNYILSKIKSVVLSTSTSSTSTDTAATSSAVKTAKDRADEAYSKAATVESGLNGTLIYDHTYSISNGVATFTPHVYLKGSEVTTSYAASCFGWKYRLIDGSEVTLTTKSDRGCDVTISNMGYGGHVIGTFTPT